MTTAVDGCHAAGCQAGSALYIGKLDRVVCVAELLAGLLGVVLVPRLEVALVACLLNKERISVVQPWVDSIRGDLLAFEPKIGVNGEVEPVKPAVRITSEPRHVCS